MPLDRITRLDVTRWFDRYSATAPGGANFILKVFHQIMNRAIVHGHIAANPASAIKRNPRPRLTRFLSQDEIRRLHAELDNCVADRPSRRRQADIIRLLLLTGCRRSEIQSLQWHDVGIDSLELWRQQDRAQACAPEQGGTTHHREATQDREPVCLSIAIRPVPVDKKLDPALGHGQETLRDRGRAMPWASPHIRIPGGAERNPLARRGEVTWSQHCFDDLALCARYRP